MVEEVTDAGGSHTGKHFDEVGAGDGEEGHAGFPCDGACQQGFTGARRAVEKHAAGDLGTEFLVPVRVLEKVFDLVEFFHSFVFASHIVERGGGAVFVDAAGGRFTEAHGAVLLHAPEEPHHEEDKEQSGA